MESIGTRLKPISDASVRELTFSRRNHQNVVTAVRQRTKNLYFLYNLQHEVVYLWLGLGSEQRRHSCPIHISQQDSLNLCLSKN